jgi:hypothetical protein
MIRAMVKMMISSGTPTEPSITEILENLAVIECAGWPPRMDPL